MLAVLRVRQSKPYENTSFITARNTIVKAKSNNCCFLGRLNPPVVAKDGFNVTSDWEGSSSITTSSLPDHSIRLARMLRRRTKVHPLSGSPGP